MAKYLCIWVNAYWFSVTSFSKWLPGGHIRFFGFWLAWFRSVTQVCFGISVSNFMCMSLVAVGRSLTIVSYVAFKMAALWFWTMFNCNPPIAHCHPLLWGGGILIDHWSTISSYQWPNDYKIMHKARSSIEEVPYCFSRSFFKFFNFKIIAFDPNWAFPDCNLSLNSPMVMKYGIKLEETKKRCPIVFQGYPSNLEVTRDNKSPILTRIKRFRTVTLVWIHR